MRKHLAFVLEYFAFFSYVPSFSEIYTFFPKKITKKDLRTLLTSSPNHYSLATLRLRSGQVSHSRYTLPQYSIPEGKILNYKCQITNKNIVIAVQRYIQILNKLPFVRFVGVTGASAMTGWKKSDDLDLFIVTKQNFLWTTRFFVVALAKILGIHNKTGVCLNLFFDEKNIDIPIVKQNSYIAHELLQMKPVIDKNDVYSLLIQANEWISNYFPNTPSGIPAKAGIQDDRIPASAGMTQIIDHFFKSIQLPIIIKNKTGFRITDHQLWLFKRDFEIKLKRNGLGR